MAALAGATQTIAGTGSLTIAANGTLTFTPETGKTGAIPSCTYVMQDAGGLTATATITFTNIPAQAEVYFGFDTTLGEWGTFDNNVFNG